MTEVQPRAASPRLVAIGKSDFHGAPSRAGQDPIAYPAGTFANLFDLSGNVALLVGSGGLGTAIAAGLADFGARIVIADLNLDAAKRVAAMCVRSSENVPQPLAARLDVTDLDEIQAVVAAIEEEAGKIDILVNAAGIQICQPALEVTPANWQKIISINLSGVFFVTQAVAHGMLDRGYGRILSIGSVSSLLGHPEHAPYAASKGGIAIMTKSLATEWAPHGVTVNAIGPTYTETELTRHLVAPPGAREALEAMIPMGRLGLPEDLVGAALFLCSDAGGFVTGQTIYVDGGRTID
jgi:NAD(P)-dependent dehydrogenase (short-subunit alcohol dehydrogenase family)